MTTREAPVAVQRLGCSDLGPLWLKEAKRDLETRLANVKRSHDACKEDGEYQAQHKPVLAALESALAGFVGDYQRDIAAAERRGAERAQIAAASGCVLLIIQAPGQLATVHNGAVSDCIDAIRSLPIEQILKGN